MQFQRDILLVNINWFRPHCNNKIPNIYYDFWCTKQKNLNILHITISHIKYVIYIFTRQAEFTRIYQNLKHIRVQSCISLHITILHVRSVKFVYIYTYYFACTKQFKTYGTGEVFSVLVVFIKLAILFFVCSSHNLRFVVVI